MSHRIFTLKRKAKVRPNNAHDIPVLAVNILKQLNSTTTSSLKQSPTPHNPVDNTCVHLWYVRPQFFRARPPHLLLPVLSLVHCCSRLVPPAGQMTVDKDNQHHRHRPPPSTTQRSFSVCSSFALPLFFVRPRLAVPPARYTDALSRRTDDHHILTPPPHHRPSHSYATFRLALAQIVLALLRCSTWSHRSSHQK